MYGTIARMRLKPGAEERMRQLAEEYNRQNVPGYRGEIVYRLDGGSGEYLMAVLFDSKDDYVANANSPEQHQRYLEYRELLEAEPEWNDGEVISNTLAGM
jgi:antibiotic biosynthesis monooxygenase (ABM) superfamily enzyme